MIIAEDLAPLSVSDGTNIPKKKKKKKKTYRRFEQYINKLDLISIYRMLSLLAEYIFFSSALKYLPR